MRRALSLVFLASALVYLACDRTEADAGRDALLQVEGAQFYRGAMPAESGGPKVLAASVGGAVVQGAVKRAAGGELEAPATSAAIGLANDVGYWIVPAGSPVVSRPDAPTFSAVFSVSRTLAAGRYDLHVRAVDGDGRVGPAALAPLEVVAREVPTGRLVISLSWQNRADLDLHVVLPSGIEIDKRNPTEYQRPPPGAPPPRPGDPTDGGILDRDSNAQCRTDGETAENVIWAEAPPPGRYLVRVDAFSLCGAPSAPWRLEAKLDGVMIGAAQGTATESDVRFDHGRGAGVLALELDIP